MIEDNDMIPMRQSSPSTKKWKKNNKKGSDIANGLPKLNISNHRNQTLDPSDPLSDPLLDPSDPHNERIHMHAPLNSEYVGKNSKGKNLFKVNSEKLDVDKYSQTHSQTYQLPHPESISKQTHARDSPSGSSFLSGASEGLLPDHFTNMDSSFEASSESSSESSTSSTVICKSTLSDDHHGSSTSIGENSSDILCESHLTDFHDAAYLTENEQVVHRKILYEEQPFPDNYTGPSFLADIIENENMIPYDYWLCVQETGAVTQQIALVGIFTCMFLFLKTNMISVWFACLCILACLLGGFSLLYHKIPDRNQAWKYVIRSALIVVILFGTSPIMRTLTIEYSSDTIIALVVILFIVHLYTHDYAFMNGYNSHFNCSLSLNSVFFISILCASQLPTSVHAFVIVSLSILLFALFPLLRHHLKVNKEFLKSKKHYNQDPDVLDMEDDSFSYHVLTILLCITAMVMLFFFSKFLVVVFASVALFITFVIPYCLIVLQNNYKYHVSGPWDEKEIPQFYVGVD